MNQCGLSCLALTKPEKSLILHVLCGLQRISDDMFRIMSVRLLEPLIFECIQFSLNLFNSNSTVIREAKLASKDAEELQGLKKILQVLPQLPPS